MIRLLMILWQLPQEVIGFFLSRGKEKRVVHGIVYYLWSFSGSISLGDFRIISDERVLFHEYGHSIQSRYLGPFYLIIIGIPSLVWCTLKSYTHLFRMDYLSFYTERWAEELGKKKALECQDLH